MAYYPDVHPGDDVENSAERENDIRHLLNNSNGFRDGFNRAKLNSVRIPVWNLTPYTINAGALVYVVVTSDMCGDAFPVAPLNYNPYDPQFLYDDAPFGVLEKTLKAKDTGSLVLSGTVEVSITAGTSGNFAKPVPTGGFERGREGFRILHLNSAGTSAFILVGDYRMPDYQAGSGIDHAQLSGGTISTNLVQGNGILIAPVTGSTNGELSITSNISGGTDISVTGGTNGTPFVISYTGSGGGGSEFYVPAYNKLSLSGLPENSYGHATTFIVRVKAGTVGFWDEGGGAACVYTDITGSTSYTLTNKQDYVAKADGYLRISVYDDGSTPGECLSFYSPTGGVPIYKYGFMVSGIDATVSGGTAFVGLTGGTGSVRFVGENNITIYGNTNGEIVIKGSTPSITSEYSSQVGTIALKLTNGGGVVYLVPGTNVTITQVYANTYAINATGGTSGGGGIPFPDYAALTTSSSSGTVISGGTTFTATSDGWLRISIRNDSNLSDGCFRLVLNGADIGFYQYRTNSPGITRFVYIPSGTTVQYSTSSSSTFVKFAPGIGGSGLPAPIYTAMTGSGGTTFNKSTTYSIPENGWIRISIRNDSGLSDGCFRLYIDGADIGFYQYRTNSCGVTDFIPIQAGSEFRYETSSESTLVKYDHAIS